MQPLVPLVFHNLPSLYPLHLEEMIFILVLLIFVVVPMQYSLGAKKRYALYMQHFFCHHSSYLASFPGSPSSARIT